MNPPSIEKLKILYNKIKILTRQDNNIYTWFTKSLFLSSIFISVSLIVIFCLTRVRFFRNPKWIPVKDILDKLKHLHDRCYAQITKESQIQNALSSSLSALFGKTNKVFPLANPREIENELISILKELRDFRRYIFVFDELDKIDLLYTTDSGSNGKQSTLNDQTERRRKVTDILASMKYFVSEADAKFIFIAGREMFDAAMADISDRQSSIGSIFHKIIYVDSFLKDKREDGKTVWQIGSLIEYYLVSRLMPNENIEELKKRSGEYDFFKEYCKFLYSKHPENESEARKIIFTLQNFLGYLFYRSNGSPKKAVKLFEEYIVKLEKRDFEKIKERRDIIFRARESSTFEENQHYLLFSTANQYRIGFINYLFQPFLAMNSISVREMSDNTLVSIPFLMDNLIKFHPFAFSYQNLELFPEIMATNRTPVSRSFLDSLIEFMGHNLIRPTEIGLFEFKFYDRVHNEIVYITKLFEEESAAFNFTHDETYPVKAYLLSKINELRTTHSTNASILLRESNPIVSVLFLYRILGDVYFQNEEYQEAVACYQDALQMISLNRLSYPNHLISFIIIKLKLGLCYEKLKTYEIALGNYASVIEDGAYHLEKNREKHQLIYKDITVLLMQAHLALLSVQEKLFDGINFEKIENSIKSFLRINRMLKREDKDSGEMVLASFFKGLGNILYFKNIILPIKQDITSNPSVAELKSYCVPYFFRYC